jgi:fructosamine-3-kinase
MHGVKFDEPFKISENNEKIVLDWKQHLKNTLETAIQRQLDEQTDIPKDFLEKIRYYALSKIENITPPLIALLHGDLHDGNTLIKDDKVVLYDKSSELFAGDPLYDLTIIMTHFPNGAYVHTDNLNNANDSKLLEAFIKGYGQNFLQESKDLLDLYLVIRALDRYPNPFETFNKQIIENIVL